jgi:hypothetical protein
MDVGHMLLLGTQCIRPEQMRTLVSWGKSWFSDATAEDAR